MPKSIPYIGSYPYSTKADKNSTCIDFESTLKWHAKNLKTFRDLKYSQIHRSLDNNGNF